MIAGHNDPRLLYEIHGIKAHHIRHGEESDLTPSGPQTLSLLMVPTSSPFADLSTADSQADAPEEDFYLHLHLPPEMDLPLPANTQIYHKPPRSYLIPRWDLGSDSGAFTRIDFPEKSSQDDIDTFETILAQCTAFMERAPAPTGEYGHKPYNPADWAAGNRLGGGKTETGQLVLIDEDDGSVVGELGPDAHVVEDPRLSHGSKNPVEIQISQDGSTVTVAPLSEDYLQLARHPAYKDSSIVQNAAAASRLIVTGSSYLGNVLAQGADSFTQKTKPVDKPLTFGPATHERVRKVHAFTAGGASLSAKTVGQATKYAQNIGASMSRRGGGKDKDKHTGKTVSDDYKPGFLNKSMIAFSTVADGIAESGRSLLTVGSTAAETIVGHRYGPDAQKVAAQLAGGVKNVGLVYIDVTGVSRRAIIKSVAKGMVVGHVKGGGQVVVGGGDGGAIPESDIAKAAGKSGVGNDGPYGTGEGEVGFGTSNRSTPSYRSELGEPLGSGNTKKTT
ncbi:hypothetical protein FH972_021893 [Carpinus fangiana]|uniref:Senescence domain-containing protein n=1 Tax=Carpinus fangiana TaxID=176857 RepID=A0A5N6KR68_9ROSI|nr:hypothetical protein FH972_021893 [Carpinus fangiana]